MANKEKTKNSLLFWAKLGITGVILYFVLRQVPVADYKHAFSLLTPQTLAFLVSTVILQVFILAYRWSYLTFLTTNSKLPIIEAFVGTLMSFFFSQGLPASIGGDAFRVWWVSKRGISTNSAMKVVFFDRIYGLIALTLACAGSVLLYFTFVGKNSTQVSSLIGVILLASAILGLFVVPFKMGLSKYFVNAARYLPSWITSVVHWLLQSRDSLRQHNMVQSSILVGTSLLTHCIVILQAYIIGRILSPDTINFVICLLAVPPALFISYMPFSIAGWGVRETSMVMAFGLFGVKASAAIIISLTIGMAVLVTSLIGGVFWITEWRSKHNRALEILNKNEVS